MKTKMMSFAALCLLALIVGVLAYVRLAPSDPARWHVDPSNFRQWDQGGPWGDIVPVEGGAILRLPSEDAQLARVEAIAMSTPRTVRLAGSVAEDRITWITRSAFWGFPDYTTAEQRADGLYLYARLRFGKSDLGVNAARLRDWQSKL